MARPDWWTEVDGLYGYDVIVRSLGHEVVAQEDFGSYQGDIGYILRAKDGRVGTLVVGYGSCSGCDQLEAEKPWRCYGDEHGAHCDCDWTGVEAIRDEMVGNVRWGELLQAKGEAHWWTFDEPLHTWLCAEYVKAVTP